VGSGTRSEKIRTYNYKDSRCTDHRLNSNFALDPVLSGEIEPVRRCAIAPALLAIGPCNLRGWAALAFFLPPLMDSSSASQLVQQCIAMDQQDRLKELAEEQQ
jgi:hypothetical protein